jgi:hypothetical protein
MNLPGSLVADQLNSKGEPLDHACLWIEPKCTEPRPPYRTARLIFQDSHFILPPIQDRARRLVSDAAAVYPRLAQGKVVIWSMEQVDLVLLFKLFTVLALLLVALLFGADFRGGRPRTPMHPSPADDSALLRKKRNRKRTNCGVPPGSLSASWWLDASNRRSSRNSA